MWEIIQSAWWIVYYINKDNQPRYLLIKRHALSWKIERVAPKGKIQSWEDVSKAALREVSEETWIPINQMKIKQKIWTTQLRNTDNQKWQMDKDVTYFLIEYFGDPDNVNIDNIEWYIWVYKRASFDEILWLIYYQDIRELMRQCHMIIKEDKKKFDIKKQFMQKLDL